VTLRRFVVLAGAVILATSCSSPSHRYAQDSWQSTTQVTAPVVGTTPSKSLGASGMDAVSGVASAAAQLHSAPLGSYATYNGQLPGPPFYVAQALASSVQLYDSSSSPTPRSSLSNPNEDGAPLVFLVVAKQADWLQVLLPLRPNGSVGWIHSSDVTLRQHDYHVLVELGSHRITAWKGGTIIDAEPIGVGTANSPTPGGNYYVTEALQVPDPSGPYGPYALGLSGYSNVYQNFNGGNGVIGIHGTNEPSGIGRDVSHGCIRLSNAGITMLAHTLPLGTPVVIAA
jgi:lipoprotein-anchoring transpeptidase ErfK/SrfK